MGSSMSREEIIEENTPKEVCPPDEVFAIKKKHLERIKHLVTS